MRILIVGNGGREHALLWKLRRDGPEAEFFATEPNGGMAALAEGVQISPGDIETLAAWAASHSIDLTVVGPEAPLAGGIVDRFQERGLPVFGPSQAAARIESSKVFAKELMRSAGIPTADFQVFREPAAAEEYVRRKKGTPVVVKASGLAAGKGAIVCDREEEALRAIRDMLTDRRFGEAGAEIVIEERMSGEELSVFALTDGRAVLFLVPSQDHKPIGEGDVGPNTGGMGAYAPVSLADGNLVAEIEKAILLPTLKALEEAGAPFRGLLYAGLMLTQDGPRVVEFNCRFGDPETQVVVPLLEGSLLEILATVAEGGSLAGKKLGQRPGAAVTTVLASAGYPGRYETGKPIAIPHRLMEDPDLILFHAGTRQEGPGLMSAGGRVLAVTGIGNTLGDASRRSLLGADAIDFDGKYFRTDIGWREFARDEGSRP